MYLQTIEINGFKSFANKTRLVFEPGITAIVGPNGCGKSNVSDAIRWVLGEQRPTALRSGAMTDVIFNGTDEHKPMGMAEVSITFADCEKELGTEYNEVTVTRRVFRTGEGQYFLNKTPCRLRDIQRLFMDTGIGTTSYSVMAQGQIDAILSSRPEDRRAIFEEASGITRFRADRREALRKLEATDQNLTRLDDVVQELRRQIGSLQRQASRARRYRAMQDELRKYDLFLVGRRLGEFNTRAAGLDAEFAAARKETEALRERVAEAERALSALRQEIAESEQGVSEAVERAAQAHGARAQADEKLRVNAQRIEENRGWKERDEREIAGTSAVREDQEKRKAELTAQLEGLSGELDAARKALDEARKTFDTLHADTDDARASLQKLRDQSVELERTGARLQNELSAAEASAREAILRNERLSSEKSRLEESVTALSARLEAATAETASLRDAAHASADAVVAADKALRERRAALQSVQASRAQLRAQLAACEARLKVLEDSARSSDGLPAGSAKLLSKKNPLKLQNGAVLGSLAEQFSAPKEARTALQAVLRAWLDAVAVRSADDIPAILSALGDAPARIVSADAAGLDPKPEDVSSDPALAPLNPRRLIDAVRPKAGFEKAAAQLLAGVWIVDSLPAPSATSAFPFVSFVTPAGTVLRPGGVADVYGNGAASNPFSRHDQLEDTRAEAASLAEKAAAGEGDENAARESVAEAERALAAARAALDEARAAAARKEGEERSLSRDLSASKSALSQTAAELEKLTASSKDATEHTRDLSARIHDMADSRTRLADAVAAQSETVRKTEAGFLEAQSKLTDARLAHASVSQRAESAKNQLSAVAARLGELDGMIRSRRESLAGYEEGIARLEAENKETTDGIPELDKAAEEADANVAALRSTRAEKQARADKSDAELQRERATLDEASARQNHAEVALAEARIQLQNLADGLQRNWHLTVEELAREQTPDWGEEGEPDLDSCQAKVNELREKMDAMGPVNLVAIEDCQKSEERLEFLTAQQKDLTEAKAKLLELIKDIDRQSVDRFRETFVKANENFQKMYQRLFGGGTAELKLLDEDDVLECGIDIIARPPGKRPQSISLLSGGERTMTAVALLFSIYGIKPSPFAILDELDAALDDSNIGRFVDVLKDFLQLSQFLIITHNQHTIAGSDIVYGVTQQEKGISTIISMRLKRVGVAPLEAEEMPAPDAPPPPGKRKMRNAENYVKKPKAAAPENPEQPQPEAPATDATEKEATENE